MSTLGPESTDDATAIGSTQLTGSATNAASEHIVSALMHETVRTQVSDLLCSPDGNRIRTIINANREAALTQGRGSTRGAMGIDMPGSSAASVVTGTPSQSVPTGLVENDRIFSEAEMDNYNGIAQLCVRSLIDNVVAVSATGVSNTPGMSIECVALRRGDAGHFELVFRTTDTEVETFKAVFNTDMGQDKTGPELDSVELMPRRTMSAQAVEQQRLRYEQSQ